MASQTLWFLVAGGLLVLMALSGTVLKRLPLSASLVYLAVGFGLHQAGVETLSPSAHATAAEHLTEIAVIISLFAAGLKLRLPLSDKAWRLPIRLASSTMLVTVIFLAGVCMALLGLPLGAALLLAAILAPTDPVLASEVQVDHPTDSDRLRFGLTGEAGLNDGAAFPFVMLGLGLLGLHPLGAGWSRWLAVDVAWAVVAGLGVGWSLGNAIGRVVIYLRHRHREAIGLDDFLALGLIGLSYGAAVALHAYGFLAVFAAGYALRRTEARSGNQVPSQDMASLAIAGASEEVATRSSTAPAYMAQAVLGFTEALERMGEAALMVLVGAMLASVGISGEGLVLAAALFFVVRPAAVALTLQGSAASARQKRLIAWFGIRGIGSLYYLFYALGHGVDVDLGERLSRLVLTVVAASAVLHGISVTPLMTRYRRRKERRSVTGISGSSG
jgi:NhaP-type Na+/H+ or K+/H+ antiporter